MAIMRWHLNKYRPMTGPVTPANAAPPEKSETTQSSTGQGEGQLKLFGFKKKVSGTMLALPPNVKKDVFLNAILETPTAKPMRRNPLEWAGATTLHLAILAALIIVPLYSTGAIHLPEYDAVPLVAPPPPPPPAPAVAAAPRVVRPQTAQLTYKVRKITAPTAIPKKVALGDASAPPPDLGSVAGVPGGVAGGQIGGLAGGVFGGTGAVAPTPPPEQKATPKLVRVGSNLKAPRQTHSVEPEYPTLALETHIHGIVLVDAIIDEHGNVVQARAISGHPLLIPPALRAVLQWKYEPTTLNGHPVSVELQVSVNFR